MARHVYHDLGRAFPGVPGRGSLCDRGEKACVFCTRRAQAAKEDFGGWQRRAWKHGWGYTRRSSHSRGGRWSASEAAWRWLERSPRRSTPQQRGLPVPRAGGQATHATVLTRLSLGAPASREGEGWAVLGVLYQAPWWGVASFGVGSRYNSLVYGLFPVAVPELELVATRCDCEDNNGEMLALFSVGFLSEATCHERTNLHPCVVAVNWISLCPLLAFVSLGCPSLASTTGSSSPATGDTVYLETSRSAGFWFQAWKGGPDLAADCWCSSCDGTHSRNAEVWCVRARVH